MKPVPMMALSSEPESVIRPSYGACSPLIIARRLLTRVYSDFDVKPLFHRLWVETDRYSSNESGIPLKYNLSLAADSVSFASCQSDKKAILRYRLLIEDF